MDKRSAPRILLAAPRSGSGKTLITCALLKSLKESGKDPVAFKCGPDYIDPLFHERVLGIGSYNLDSYFMDKEQLKHSLGRTGNGIAVIEGVMGIYDGLGVDSIKGSCYEIAAMTDTPVVLIIDAHGAGRSIISLIKGVLSDDRRKLIKGVILNRISNAFFARLSPVLSQELQKEYPDVRVLGSIPDEPALKIGSRHLGLDISAARDEVLRGIGRMAELMSIDHGNGSVTENILKLACPGDSIIPASGAGAPDNSFVNPAAGEDRGGAPAVNTLTLAVAKDEAFCFYYKDNLELLERYGVTIKYFSPVHDKALPGEADGILLGGGYPEMYLEELSSNTAMLDAVREAVNEGMPSLAECGGFMYLHKSVSDIEGKRYPLAGVIEGECIYTGKSVRFGYMSITGAEDDSPGIAKMLKGMKGHEFHYYDSTANGGYCMAGKPDGSKKWSCMCGNEVSLWGFPHFYYPSAPESIRFFVTAMAGFKEKKSKIKNGTCGG